jgi:hypothetical protein
MCKGRGPSTYEVEGPLSSAAPATRSPSPLSAARPHDPHSASRLLSPPRTVRSAAPRKQSDRSARRLYGTRQRRCGESQQNIGRLDACLPGRRLSPGATRQVVDHLRTPQPLARLRELPAVNLADPWGFPPDPVTVSGGVRDFYRRQTRCARGWRKGFRNSLVVHRDGQVTPTSRPVIHRLSTDSSTHAAALRRRSDGQ